MEGREHGGVEFNSGESEEMPEVIEKTEQGEKLNEYPYNGIMVFGHGCKKDGWNLSWESKARAVAAYQLWKDGLAPVIILTGGKSTSKNNESLPSNAEIMKTFLEQRFSVPESAIVLEDAPGSIKTVDNVGLAINSIEQKGLPTDDFITVSTGFHLDRITQTMDRYGLKSQPVSAEVGLSQRAKEHAELMKQKDIEKGLSAKEIEHNYVLRLGRYDRFLERVKLKSDSFKNELRDEPKWQEAMNNWGYWGPLALAVRGEKLKEVVETNRDDIKSWLSRHPEIELTIEDLIEGNFDYRELVEKGRELP